MERSAWTDDRLDDMAARNDRQFELLRGDMAEMRTEMREGFAQLRTEMADMRSDFRADMVDFRTEMRDTRRDMFHGVIALFGSQAALFAVLLAHTL